MPIKVFISYSHDDDAHVARVRKLADSLRKFGVECQIDQYEKSWSDGDAAHRMRRWIVEADYVLVVCTQTYARRFEQDEAPGKGQGARLEGLYIRNLIQAADAKNTKFIPVIFEPDDKDHRPLLLQGAKYYPVDTQAGFESLYSLITGQDPDPPPPVGEVVSLPTKPSRESFARPGSTPPIAASVPSLGPSTVPTPSATFVPRKEITKKIHDALAANPEQVVLRQAVARALGGYGKTVAAILYAHEYAVHYPGGRFFMPVESGNLVGGLAGLTGVLDLAATNKPQADAEAVKRHLESAKPSLLILDNVANRAAWDEMLASGLVPRGGCRVLVTTRDESIAPADAIQVGRLTSDEAREVYRRFCVGRREREKNVIKRDALPDPLPTDAIADAITEWLGGLAVAVAAVAAFMNLKPHIAWETYWMGDGKNLRGLKHTPVAELPDVKPDVATQLGLSGGPLEAHRRTIRVIDDAYAALPLAARRAVDYAALLPQDLAPAHWLVALLEADAARLPSADGSTPHPLFVPLASDPDESLSPAQAVLRHLDNLDILLPGGEDGKLLSLHRLWHARVNEFGAGGGSGSKIEVADRTSLLLAIAACAAARRANLVGGYGGQATAEHENPAVVTESSLRWELKPLADVCKLLWAADLPGPAARVGVWLAALLRLLGSLHDAAACLQLSPESEVQIEAELGHAGLAACYSNLAVIQRSQGYLLKAMQSMSKAISIKLKYVAPDNPSLATSFSNLAGIQMDLGDYLGAMESVDKAVKISRRYLPPTHPSFATIYSNIASIKYHQNDYVSAREYLEKSIQIDLVHGKKNSPSMAVSYSNLSAIQLAQGDLPAARRSMEASIDIASHYFSETHPHMGTKYSNLAMIQLAEGDICKARFSIDRAIKIQSKNFVPDHPSLAVSYTNLAHICHAEGNRSEACSNFDRALHVFRKHFEESHPNIQAVLNAMNELGCLGGAPQDRAE